MDMNFIEVKVNCPAEFSEILIAEFAEIGFTSFLEREGGFDAYMEEANFIEQNLLDLQERYGDFSSFSYTLHIIAKQNWNEEWEKNYNPIIISDQCIVKASFHNIKIDYPYQILINPKMSFGTGHHATTFLMLSQQLEMDFNEKMVLDAGCGTGILSIMASFKGAKHIHGCDIDEWSVTNSIENVKLNNCNNIDIYHGKVSSIPPKTIYDIVLANINKNVLLEEIPSYYHLMSPGGSLVLSGFYEQDIPDIEFLCAQHRLKKVNYRVKDTWACVLFHKN